MVGPPLGLVESSVRSPMGDLEILKPEQDLGLCFQTSSLPPLPLLAFYSDLPELPTWN